MNMNLSKRLLSIILFLFLIGCFFTVQEVVCDSIIKITYVSTADDNTIYEMSRIVKPGDSLELFKKKVMAYGIKKNVNYDLVLANNFELYKAFSQITAHIYDFPHVYKNYVELHKTCLAIQREVLVLVMQDLFEYALGFGISIFLVYYFR